MCAVKTNVPVADFPIEERKKLLGHIRKEVPVGFAKHQAEQNQPSSLPKSWAGEVITREWSNAMKSLGTLGGGNHFIELQSDGDNLWIMIHSGSRNLGKTVADVYNKKAVALNERWRSVVPREHELAFLPVGTPEFKAYIDEMQFCVQYAFENRLLMIQRIIEGLLELRPELITDPVINIAHNYARYENHFGKNVMIHRKGATAARSAEIGIIPGSQGTSSYIVKGKGNAESFASCSHGAGRRMGRKQAQRELNVEEQVKLLDAKGILHAVRGTSDLDEAPGAYKDIDVVMAEQADLVEILVKLTPLAVVKG